MPITETGTMSPAQYKVHENKLRRMAARQGFSLLKSRRRDPRAVDDGSYSLVDEQNCLVTPGPSWSLEGVERYLTGEWPE
jgi:hypothetical protein